MFGWSLFGLRCRGFIERTCDWWPMLPFANKLRKKARLQVTLRFVGEIYQGRWLHRWLHIGSHLTLIDGTCRCWFSAGVWKFKDWPPSQFSRWTMGMKGLQWLCLADPLSRGLIRSGKATLQGSCKKHFGDLFEAPVWGSISIYLIQVFCTPVRRNCAGPWPLFMVWLLQLVEGFQNDYECYGYACFGWWLLKDRSHFDWTLAWYTFWFTNGSDKNRGRKYSVEAAKPQNLLWNQQEAFHPTCIQMPFTRANSAGWPTWKPTACWVTTSFMQPRRNSWHRSFNLRELRTKKGVASVVIIVNVLSSHFLCWGGVRDSVCRVKRRKTCAVPCGTFRRSVETSPLTRKVGPGGKEWKRILLI